MRVWWTISLRHKRNPMLLRRKLLPSVIEISKTIVYPNPSSDGKVNIVFEDANVSRDISVSDMSGRTVKQLKGVTANNITIDNLTPGMYSLRIVIPSTGDQSVEKIMVNKR